MRQRGGGWVGKKSDIFFRFLMTKGGAGVSQKVTMHDISREGWGAAANSQKIPNAWSFISVNV